MAAFLHSAAACAASFVPASCCPWTLPSRLASQLPPQWLLHLSSRIGFSSGKQAPDSGGVPGSNCHTQLIASRLLQHARHGACSFKATHLDFTDTHSTPLDHATGPAALAGRGCLAGRAAAAGLVSTAEWWFDGPRACACAGVGVWTDRRRIDGLGTHPLATTPTTCAWAGALARCPRNGVTRLRGVGPAARQRLVLPPLATSHRAGTGAGGTPV